VKALVTGAAGQLGSDLVRALADADVVGLGRGELDLLDASQVRSVLREHRPDVVFNAAAYTNVDAAEVDEAAALAVNGTGAGALAAACADLGAVLVHVSTDYVFAGDAATPYAVDATTGPRSAYGRTKLAGEHAVRAALADHRIVRTAWVYGAVGSNFVKTIARLERERDSITVVDDQRGSPTWSWQLAQALVGVAAAAPGTYHATNRGDCTWFEFARAIFVELSADPERVQPCTTADFPRPAPRPAYSVLEIGDWPGSESLAPWRAALHDAFATVGDALRPPA
jgi:dTDP-4-dehydrorhamnose reductase